MHTRCPARVVTDLLSILIYIERKPSKYGLHLENNISSLLVCQCKDAFAPRDCKFHKFPGQNTRETNIILTMCYTTQKQYETPRNKKKMIGKCFNCGGGLSSGPRANVEVGMEPTHMELYSYLYSFTE